MSKKGLVFALSIYFSSNLSLTFMGANVDDYYSSMTSDKSGESSSDKKKPIIKKKLIVRAKKAVVIKETPVIQEPIENTDESISTDIPTQASKPKAEKSS
jgi:hypothetical protein